MKNVIICGVTGLLGMSLAKLLLKKNIFVVGIGRNDEKLKELEGYSNFYGIRLEFEEYKNVAKVLPYKDSYDAVYYFSWSGGFLQNALQNYVLQSNNVVAACDFFVGLGGHRIKKYVYAGTINEIEIQQCMSQIDTFQLRGTCIYSSAKLSAEIMTRTLAQRMRIAYCTGLVPMVYGENNYSKQLFNVVMEKLLKGTPPDLTEGKNLYDLVYIDDIAGGFEAIGQSGKTGKRYYIGHRQLQTFRKWMEDMRDVIAPNVSLNFGAYKDSLNLDYSLLDLDSLYKDTGFVCSSDFRESVKRTVDWYRSIGNNEDYL